MSDQLRPIPTLSPVQAQVVAALASGITITAAASAAGIHRATIYNWRKSDPAFNTFVSEAEQECAAQLRDQLLEIQTAAIDTIRQILTDLSIPPSIRLKAALAVLTWTPPSPPRTPTLAATPPLDPPVPLPPTPHPPSPEPPAPESPSARTFVRFAAIARSAPCPCGSGEKYKRCCGRQAPPQLCRPPAHTPPRE